MALGVEGLSKKPLLEELSPNLRNLLTKTSFSTPNPVIAVDFKVISSKFPVVSKIASFTLLGTSNVLFNR
jgi:hypothetical protein